MAGRRAARFASIGLDGNRQYNQFVTQFYDIDEANARVPEVREVLGLLRDHRAELIRLRDRISVPEADDGEQRRIHLRMQGIVDQMQAAVVQLDSWSITLRDIESGLVDFPALVNGRQVCLCWKLGEGDIDWWHELTAGYSGRRPLAELG
jgi:hypothetical protein